MLTGSPHAYLSVTDVHGEVKLALRYVQLDGNQVMFQTERTLKCDDPLATVEVVVPLPPLPLISGVFALEVLCDDELLGAHRIIVDEMQE